MSLRAGNGGAEAVVRVAKGFDATLCELEIYRACPQNWTPRALPLPPFATLPSKSINAKVPPHL